MEDLKVVRIVPEALTENLWNRIVLELDEFIVQSHGRCTIHDLLIELMHERQQLWIGYTGEDDLVFVIITAVTDYPSKRFMTISFVSGKNVIDTLDLTHRIIKEFGEKYDCVGFEFYGRKGWSRVLKDSGWYGEHIVMTEDW